MLNLHYLIINVHIIHATTVRGNHPTPLSTDPTTYFIIFNPAVLSSQY